jgi:hypothetical protein
LAFVEENFRDADSEKGKVCLGPRQGARTTKFPGSDHRERRPMVTWLPDDQLT